jgi:hypothetical protein
MLLFMGGGAFPLDAVLNILSTLPKDYVSVWDVLHGTIEKA